MKPTGRQADSPTNSPTGAHTALCSLEFSR